MRALLLLVALVLLAGCSTAPATPTIPRTTTPTPRCEYDCDGGPKASTRIPTAPPSRTVPTVAAVPSSPDYRLLTPAVVPTVVPRTRTLAIIVPVPTVTLAPAQQTAQAVSGRPIATESAKQTEACNRISGEYAKVGRVFDRAQAMRDPELALVEYRIVLGGSGDPPRTTIGLQLDNTYRDRLWTCLGIITGR